MFCRDRICSDTAEFDAARVVTFLNPYSFLQILESKVDMERFDKICIDGVALQIFLRLVYRDSDIQRLSFDFTSVAHRVFNRAVANNETGFIIGSDHDSNEGFLSKIAEMFPGIKLKGRSGYFDDEQALHSFLQSISNDQYDFIVIGMGAVMQERASNALVDFGFKGRIFTCGGFIHQTAMSGGEYYPAWIDKCNLRFAYRMFKEPSTIRRYTIDYPKAFVMLLRNIKQFKC